MTIGELFREARERQGMSRAEVARQADVTAPVITRMEDGENIGRADTVARIASVLSIPATDVFSALLEGEAERIVAETQVRLNRLDEIRGRHARESSDQEPGGRRLAAALVAGAA